MTTRTATTVLAMGVLAATLGAGAAPSGAASRPTTVATHLSAQAAKTAKLAFKGSYAGTISLLWSSSGVSVTGLRGTGTGTLLGRGTVGGTGSGTASSTCNPFSGTGSLVGGGSKLTLKVVTTAGKSQACAAGSAAPTVVSVTGAATVVSGTGKFKGAKGTLSFKGTFSIQSTTSGSSESDSFSATLTGSLTIVKK